VRLFLRLLGFLSPYRWRVALAVLLGVLTVVSNVGLLATAAYVISAAALGPLLGELALAIYLVRLFSISRAASRYAERLISHDLTFRLLSNLRARFYSRLVPLAPARLYDYRSGDLLSRIVKDVEELENVFLRMVSPVLVAAIATLIAFAVFYVFSSALAFTALAFLVATGVGVPLLVNRLARGLGRRELRLRAELGARMVDDIGGVQDLLAFGREGDERREMATLGRKLHRVQKRMAFVTGLQGALNDLMMNSAMLAVLAISIPLVAVGEIPGVYLAFLALVMLGSFEALGPLGTAFQCLGRSLAAGERLFEVVDTKPKVKDPAEPLLPPAVYDLRFEGIGFRYAEDGPPVLEDVSFALERGSRVAVVGPSGAGKSTLVNLALRFFDPTEGRVLLGGRDLREYAQEDVRAAISVFTQSTHVFNDTLRGNLLVADPDAGAAALRRALERAQLTEFVEQLPEGLETPVGEGGSQLSGGERQRLAIARTLLEDAPLLVMDEPTANLDRVTERELLVAVGEAMRGRMALVITHRLVTMEEYDEILVLDAGRVVERGTHAELAKAGGLYRRILDVQEGMLLAS
jgi:ATP-binding cassette subfamily C protein CydC